MNSADRFRQIYFLLSIAGISIMLTASIFILAAGQSSNAVQPTQQVALIKRPAKPVNNPVSKPRVLGVAIGAVPLDSLIKGSSPTIYYYAADGYRHLFPSEKIFLSWFSGYADVVTVSDVTLSTIPLKGAVTYRPGVRLIKTPSSAKVYSIDKGGVLRWIQAETTAATLYGEDWNKKIDDVPELFLASYDEGEAIADPTTFEPAKVWEAAPTINHELGIEISEHAPQATTQFELFGFKPFDDGSWRPFTLEQPRPAYPFTLPHQSRATSTPGRTATTTPTQTPSGTIPAIPAIPATPSSGDGGGATPATPATPAIPPPSTATSTPPTTATSTPPTISSVAASNITTSGATITWLTDKSADSQVEYGLMVSYGIQTTIDSMLVTSHSVALANLSPASTYHYQVKSRDSTGALAISNDFQFTTQSPPVPSVGTRKWEFQTGNAVTHTPAIGPDGTIYVSSWGCKLFALDKSGTQKWVFAAPTASTCINRFTPPAVGSDGTIYAGLAHSVQSDPATGVYAINPDGTQQWRYTTGASIFAPIVIGSDALYAIANDEKKLYALTLSGTKKWIFQADDFIKNPAIATDGTVYLSTLFSSKLLALNSDGSTKWTFVADSNCCSFSPMAIGSSGTIYAGSNDRKFYAISSSGTKLWSVAPSNAVNFGATAIGADGTVYVVSWTADNALTVHTFAADGTAQWTFPIAASHGHDGLAIGSDGVIYVSAFLTSTQEGKIIALNPNGTQKWLFSATPTYTNTSGIAWGTTAPAIDSDGTLYSGIHQSVYAVTSDSSGLASSPWPKIYSNNRNTGLSSER